jgi:hypothetical protein
LHISSKNIRNLPTHFSLVFGDLIGNKNREYGLRIHLDF